MLWSSISISLCAFAPKTHAAKSLCIEDSFTSQGEILRIHFHINSRRVIICLWYVFLGCILFVLNSGYTDFDKLVCCSSCI